MSNELQYITPIHVRDYLFCPSILYNKYVRRIVEPETEMMAKGREEYERDKAGLKRRKTILGDRRIKADKVLFSKPLKSEKYRLAGVVDCIYWKDNKLHVLEIKYTKTKKPFPDHIYQTATYAIMAEEEFKQPVYRIILYYKYSKLWHERRFTRQLKAHTLKIIEKTRRILDGEEIPIPKWKLKCKSCWYKRICHPSTT